jgi:thioredoxin 1
MAGKVTKIAIVVVLITAVCGIIIYKHIKSNDSSLNNTLTTIDVNQQQANRAEPQSSKALPRLVDLGADKCIPCKMMTPILEELKREYAGQLEVEFIDVWKNPDEAKKYEINIIPTQIFYDASGKELFRHEGFISKEDILGEWKELGVELTKTK